MTHALRPTKVTSGAIHHQSVRNVVAAMEARARTAPGLVAVVDIVKLPDRARSLAPGPDGRIKRRTRGSSQPSVVRVVWHTLRRGSDGFSVRSAWVRHTPT